MRIPKINSIHFALPWLGAGLLVGGVLPFALKQFTGREFRPLVWIGGSILLAFAVVFALEMVQDFGKVPHYQKQLAKEFPYDPATHEAVLCCSICTGEQVAGFRNCTDGSFVEVLVIRSPEDLALFQATFHLNHIKKEY